MSQKTCNWYWHPVRAWPLSSPIIWHANITLAPRLSPSTRQTSTAGAHRLRNKSPPMHPACWAICSSRQCKAALDTLTGSRDFSQPQVTTSQPLKSLLAAWYGAPSDVIRIHANGMASIANALRAVHQLKPQPTPFRWAFPTLISLRCSKHLGPSALCAPP